MFKLTDIAITGQPMPMAAATGFAPDYSGSKQNDLVMSKLNNS